MYWVADAFLYLDIYREDELLISARDIAISAPVLGDPTTYYDTLEEYMLSGSGLWYCLGEYNAGGPEPPPNVEPPGWAKCTFDTTWIKPDLTSGVDWLPEPGSIIGLPFKFERDDVPATVTIRYNVYNISTWQGECMNYPVDAPKPQPTGTGTFFDFTVVDTAKYDIEIYDYDAYNGHLLENPPGNPINVASMRRYVLIHSLNFVEGQTTVEDTLWLKAHDYGAKAIVSPSTGQTWRDMMQMRTTAFGQKVWSVSVPRDDDGQAFTGYNRGDFVADAWEESVLGLQSESSDSSIVGFVPFYQFNETGSLVYADRDSIPKGRNIKGDAFCNWEEYRGFITVGDQFGFYLLPASEKHMRLDPFTKNVMVHFRPNAEARSEAPGWMNALPDTMAYLVDHLTPLDDADTTRTSLRRWVNLNKYGAYYPYYSARSSWGNGINWGTTNVPASGYYQNAVVYWGVYRGENPNLINNHSYGYTYGYRAFEAETFIPIWTEGIVVNTDVISREFADTLYNPNFVTADSIKLIKQTIAHELGHSIAMPHDTDFDYIMEETPTIQYDWQGYWRFVLELPGFNQAYSDSSKKKISIKKEGQ